MITSEDSNYIAETLIRVINEELDEQAPMRKIKIKENNQNKYSEETIELINNKNIIYNEYIEDKTSENMIKLKNIKIEVKKIKLKEDFINKKKRFSEKANNPKESWKEARKQLYGNDINMTDRIIENNSIKIGSKNVSNVINRYYIRKVNKIKWKAIVNT